MRWTISASVTLLVGLASSASAGQPACANCNSGPTAAWVARGFGAEACASPCGYSLQPGCCEDTRHCCDNAWDGYCEHRARVDAFWARVGTPEACGRGCFGRAARGAGCETCLPCSGSNCNGSPTPAKQAAPPQETAPMPPVPAESAARSARAKGIRQ